MSGTRQLQSAVVDLNLFVSGLISAFGQPRRLLDQFRNNGFTLVISQQLRDELDEVLRRDKFTRRLGHMADVRDAIFSRIDHEARFVEPVSPLDIAVRDPKDGIVLATALGGRADYLVTGDPISSSSGMIRESARCGS